MYKTSQKLIADDQDPKMMAKSAFYNGVGPSEESKMDDGKVDKKYAQVLTTGMKRPKRIKVRNAKKHYEKRPIKKPKQYEGIYTAGLKKVSSFGYDYQKQRTKKRKKAKRKSVNPKRAGAKNGGSLSPKADSGNNKSMHKDSSSESFP